MKIQLTAEYVPPQGSARHNGSVVIKMGSRTVLSTHAVEFPGAEPGAEDHVIAETVADILTRLVDVLDAHDGDHR